MTGTEVLVGVDGSTGAMRAVDLGVLEARLRGLPLRIVYAQRRPHAEAGLIAAEAAARAWSRFSDLRVTDQVLSGEPDAVLAAEAAGAALIVVGERQDGFTERLLGSVLTGLLGRASVPVLVARGSTHPGGHVVVGVAGDPSDHGVGSPVEFAFTEASLRGAPLLAMHAWEHPITDRLAGLLPGRHGVPEAEREAELGLVSAALSGWQERFPDVVVHQRVLHERAREALAAESAGAQLVVVGGTGRELLREPLAGFLVRESECPVAMVRHRHA